MKNLIIKLRIFLWLMLAGVVCWLLYMAVVPSGKISYVYDFTKPNYFIGKLTPEERVALIYDGNQKIIGDPVYFSLRTPRRFNKARLTLKYKNNNDLPIIEAGVLADKTIWRYDLQPIENKIINDLALVWDAIWDNGVMLLQREKKYNSIDEFLENSPDRNEIALYNYSLQKEFLLEDYAPKKEFSFGYPELSSFFALRGPYQFYTYIKSEDLDFNFVFQDLNKNKDSDPIDLHLYYNDQLIDSRHLDDETSPPTDAKALAGKPAPLLNRRGEIEREGIIGDERSLELRLANLPEGVYKIELRVNDDIITKSIIAKQQKMAFINKLWLADGGSSDINLWTDSKLINAQTVNPGSLQPIKITPSAPSAAAALDAINIEQTYKQFSATVSGTTTKLTLEKDDVILSGNGVFSFSQDSLINPNFKKVDSYLDIDNDGINYILAKYDLPAEEDDWKIAFAEFDLTKAYRENGKYSFLISAHGFKADDDIDDYIEIDEIIMELEGKSLREKISEFLQ